MDCVHIVPHDIRNPIRNAVVLLRIRGVLQIGSMFVTALERYAGEQRTNGRSLVLSSINPQVMEPLRVTETFVDIPEDSIFFTMNVFGEST